jgi:hypothetical protein
MNGVDDQALSHGGGNLDRSRRIAMQAYRFHRGRYHRAVDRDHFAAADHRGYALRNRIRFADDRTASRRDTSCPSGR